MNYSLNQVIALMSLTLFAGMIGGIQIGRKSIRRDGR